MGRVSLETSKSAANLYLPVIVFKLLFYECIPQNFNPPTHLPKFFYAPKPFPEIFAHPKIFYPQNHHTSFFGDFLLVSVLLRDEGEASPKKPCMFKIFL